MSMEVSSSGGVLDSLKEISWLKDKLGEEDEDKWPFEKFALGEIEDESRRGGLFTKGWGVHAVWPEGQREEGWVTG